MQAGDTFLSSTPFPRNNQPAHWRADLMGWLPIIAGLAVLYVPSLADLFRGVWSKDEQMHGPIVLGISCWLMYRNWPAMLEASAGKRGSNWGWVFCVFALLLYTVGGFWTALALTRKRFRG